MKFSIKDFFSNCDQIRRKLRILSHLLKKSLMENFIFCAVILLQKFSLYHVRQANEFKFFCRYILPNIFMIPSPLRFLSSLTGCGKLFIENRFEGKLSLNLVSVIERISTFPITNAFLIRQILKQGS